jgi:hypothetical protein
MAKRGYKSAEERSVIALDVQGRRPSPPPEFTRREAEIWVTIAARMPLHFLSDECLPMLRALCVHEANLEWMEVQLRDLREGTMDLDDFERSLQLYQKHAAASAYLASQLRLTPKSRWVNEKAFSDFRNAPKRPLWEPK